MRIALVLGLLAATLFPVVAAEFSAQATATINVRPAPSTNNEALGQIPAGTSFIVRYCSSSDAKWCIAVAGNLDGYIDGSLAVTTEGGSQQTVSDYYAAYWAELVAKPSGASQTLASAGAELRATRAQMQSRNIVAWGDSLTAGAGSSGPNASYPAVAARLLGDGRTVENRGVGTQTSTQIAARQGGVPILVTVADNRLDTRSAITAKSVNVLYAGGDYVGTVDGTLCGARGTISTDSDGNWTWNGDAAAEPCPANSQFSPADAAETYPRTQWLLLGRNGPQRGHTVDADIAAMIKTFGHERYLVGPILPGDDTPAIRADIARVNAILSRTYGTRYVDALTPMLKAANGSAGDQEDVANGVVPRSLRVDAVHLNDKGYAILAEAFVSAQKALEAAPKS